MSGSKTVTRIGFITGIQKEAAILKKNSGTQKSDIKCAGANSKRAYNLASNLAQGGSEMLISFGVAGALDPSLNPGDLIIPDQIIGLNNGAKNTSKDHLIFHLGSCLDYRNGSLLGSEKLVTTAAEKLSLYKTTGAVAVDMESLSVATAACDHGLPFLVIRAISDTADQDLPSVTFKAIDEQGYSQLGAIIFELSKKPNELPGLIRLARNSTKALDTLRSVAALGFHF